MTERLESQATLCFLVFLVGLAVLPVRPGPAGSHELCGLPAPIAASAEALLIGDALRYRTAARSRRGPLHRVPASCILGIVPDAPDPGAVHGAVARLADGLHLVFVADVSPRTTRRRGRSMDVYQVDRCSVHAVVAVRGELDFAAADGLVESVQEHLSACRSPGIGVDLSEVTFLDCAGVRALFTVGRRAADLGVTICLAAESPAVGHVLDLLELPPGSSYLARPVGAALTISRACEVPGRLAACYEGRRVAARSDGSRSACSVCRLAVNCNLTPAHLGYWRSAA